MWPSQPTERSGGCRSRSRWGPSSAGRRRSWRACAGAGTRAPSRPFRRGLSGTSPSKTPRPSTRAGTWRSWRSWVALCHLASASSARSFWRWRARFEASCRPQNSSWCSTRFEAQPGGGPALCFPSSTLRRTALRSSKALSSRVGYEPDWTWSVGSSRNRCSNDGGSACCRLGSPSVGTSTRWRCGKGGCLGGGQR